MTYEDFTAVVFAAIKKCPECWRKGQAVFNVVDEQYGVARAVQLIDGIDCFFDESKIEAFLSAAWRRIEG